MKFGGKDGANTNLSGLEFEKNNDLAASIEENLSDQYLVKIRDTKRNAVIKSKLPVYDVIRRPDNQKNWDRCSKITVL